MRIRPASVWDLAKINEIYNFEVIHGTATFDTKQKPVEYHQEWFANQSALGLPVLVVEDLGQVIAWAALVPWSPKIGYAKTAEISIYVADGHRAKGYGKALLREIILAGKSAGLHTALARITSDNAISISMHEKLGFVRAGHLREVGQKFGKRLDVIILQSLLGN